MAKRKSTEGQTMMYKTLHRKLNIEQYERHWQPGWTQVLWKG